MSKAEDSEKLIQVLNEELGLTPYEAKAYIALLQHGPLSPSGLNQKCGIPRPRAYDVLNSLVGKGIIMEQPGRPRMYAVVDPQVGLGKLMAELERRMLEQLEGKRTVVEMLVSSLSKLHDKSRGAQLERERVWVTRRDNAFIAKYCEAIRNVEKELVVASPDPKPPEKDVLEAVEHILKKNKTVRIVRQITPQWTRRDLDKYEELITLGDRVRHLKYDGLRYAIFDKRDTVLVFPASEGSLFAVWISLPSLAAVLHDHFEALYKKGQSALPVLRKLRNTKVQALEKT